ncbi:hypothetical protein MBLNU457_2348t2 [Dothideomycetes sp. NU457]
MSNNLQFAPWTSDIELAFYNSLAHLKINHDKLDSSARKVLGLYEINHRDAPPRSTRMQIHGTALISEDVPSGFCRSEGIIRNYNTIEEYRSADRAAHIERAGRMIWDAICDGSIYSCPSLLSSFTAVCFADLKKYKFSYHFAYPALHSDPAWKQSSDQSGKPRKLTSKETLSLVDRYQTWRYSVDNRQHGFFLAKRVDRSELTPAQTPGDAPPADEAREVELTVQSPSATDDSGMDWVVSSLASFENGFFKGVQYEDSFICFVDPSTQRFKLHKAQILCYRDTHYRREHPSSIIMDLKYEVQPPTGSTTDSRASMPKVTGWERNDQGKIIPRTVDLAAFLDPTKLADQAVDLNLKLIKWRIAPTIDLDIIKNTSCLLLGAGTLGSYVARNLMGWGVRKITFVDNGRVSFSNPVRQPLFDFKDCLNGGMPKADRAAEALKEIYPGVDSEGHVLSVPMAGHPIVDEAKTKADYDKLLSLINSHDAIFLLMDTRESRWLPTVLAKAANKIVINAALGFDTYMVMRHGLSPSSQPRKASVPVSKLTASRHPERPHEEELGCYFCSDVVAPADSLKSATLDQQCTVTRPGVAPIASALAVELLVSILQSSLKGRAPAPDVPTRNADGTMTAPVAGPEHPLGSIPHQLRGFLSTWSTMTVKGKAYDCCSACSPRILGAYERDGWGFVKRAISERGYVEEISGLAEVQRRAAEAEEAGDVDWDSEDEEII